MRAAVFENFNGAIDVANMPDPRCQRDGALVEVKACGVCRSDWHAWSGNDSDVELPHIGGHEFAGVVLEVGPNCTHFKPGDRVTAPFILSCGSCADCRRGEATTCERQHVLGFSGFGAFAERVAISHADFNLVHLPDAMDFAIAAGMGCRVTTAFRALVDRAAIRPGEWLAVHGAGGVGLSAIMLATALGARVVAVDVNDEALALARALGADAVINAGTEPEVGAAVVELTGGGAHVSLDALGITATFHNSLDSLRKLGRHVQVGMPVGAHARPDIPLLDRVYARQISLLGTRGMAASRFPALFDLIAKGDIDAGRLITKRIALSETGAALEAMNGFGGTGISVIDRFDC